MKQIIKNNLPFFIPYAVLWLCGLAIVLTTTKLEQMIFINTHHTVWADYFFVGATQMGEGWFWGVIIFVFLFVRYDKALILTTSLVLSTFLSSSLKLYFDTLRPIAFFKNLKYDWHFVDGVIVNIHQSFPSGHTTTAFAIFTLLMLFTKNKNWGFLLVILAWLTGYSRNYLFQHFPEDVLAGALIGVFSSLIVYFWLMNIYKKKPKKWHK
jgi:membrane-associated phospholipid phosphatase